METSDEEQINVINQCLNLFCRCSGQKVIYLARFANIVVSQDLGRYLGVPSIHKGVTMSSCSYIMERISSRLAAWKDKTLSFAGRVILAKSVLATIPYYAMQTMFFPVGVCDEIERKIRRFIWGGIEGSRKCHMVNWDTITKSRKGGGLGLRQIRDMNLAFFTKLGWKIMTEKDNMWVKVLNTKYPTLGEASNVYQFSGRECANWCEMEKSRSFGGRIAA